MTKVALPFSNYVVLQTQFTAIKRCFPAGQSLTFSIWSGVSCPTLLFLASCGQMTSPVSDLSKHHPQSPRKKWWAFMYKWANSNRMGKRTYEPLYISLSPRETRAKGHLRLDLQRAFTFNLSRTLEISCMRKASGRLHYESGISTGQPKDGGVTM
jgi:hypothetical protein